MTRLRLFALAVLLLAGIVATAVTIWSRANANTTTKVDVDKVAQEARKSGASKQQARGLRPEPGTYTYTVSGTERVSALGGAQHSFGPEVPAVVELQRGCEWTMRFVYAEEREVTWRFCTEPEGTRLLQTDTSVTFFGHDEFVDQPCSGAATWLVKAGSKPGAKSAFSCANDKRSTDHSIVLQAPVDPPTVPGIESDSLLRIKDNIVVGGTAKGTNVIDAWFAPSGLPVSMREQSRVTSPSVLGETDYSLDVTSELTSAKPK